MYRTWPILLACLLAPTLAPGAEPSLAGRLDALMDAPDYKQARWGMLVVDAETGKTLYERSPDRLFVPASVTKLYSCAAALVALGPDFRFETHVRRNGEATGGVLKGELILVGSGDPTLGGRTDADGHLRFTTSDHIYAADGSATVLTDTDPLAGLKDLAAQVAKSGIVEVGDVLVDDRLYEHGRGSGSGPDLLTPIMVNDNVLDLIITPAEKAGGRAVVEVRPACRLFQVDADVRTVDAPGGKPKIEVLSAGTQRISVRGTIPRDHKPHVRIAEVDEPALFARALFIEALEAAGVRVRASYLARPGELPGREEVARLPSVAKFSSPPLSELLRVTLKVSHNLYASTLPLLLAVKNGERTLDAGLRRQGEVLKGLGVDIRQITFGGGAGGSIADNITPRATVQLLQAMAKRPDFPTYKAGLPVLGVDGTLTTVVGTDSPARGKVAAKTGTLWAHDALNDRMLLRSKALGGVLQTSRGKTLYFAMFVNDVPLPGDATPAREGKLLGRLCEVLVEHAP
jgi:D-alanyl-D-alanine carboxypeptidase/D-alanyl-D-alanine-endopeptidase (penicillin-binding protein 4)